MGTRDHRPSPPVPWDGTDHVPVEPDLPSVGRLLVGSVLFLKGGILMLVGIPFRDPDVRRRPWPEARTETARLEMSATAERIRAVGALRRNRMPRAEIRAVLAADDPEIVRRYLELHRERLEEQLEDRRRALDALACSLTEHLQARGRHTGRRRRGRRPDLGPTAEVG